MRPSPQQRLIYTVFQKTLRNINVSAAAGSGKTTTLVGLLDLIPRDKTARFMAFNNTIVEELKKKAPKNDNVKISTLHSFGWGCIKRKYGNKVKMDPNKVAGKTEKVLKRYPGISVKRYGYFFYLAPRIVDILRLNLVNIEHLEKVDELIMHHDYVIDSIDLKLILEVYQETVKDHTKFDFTDMIFVPATDRTIRIPRYDYVMVDESQDMSACQHALVKLAIKRDGRLVTVGDPNQAIYGFAGADANSYEKLSNINGKTIGCPLSVSYRCAKSIVREAQTIVPSISYHPSSPEGSVDWGSLKDIQRGDWILCRNLKPLVEAYMWLLKNKIKSKIRGKEIGEGLIGLITKIGAKTLDGLDRGMEREVEKLSEKLAKRGVRFPSQHPKMDALLQKIDVLEFLSNEVGSVTDLKALIRGIFSDEIQGILLSTIHKAKGLENDRIFFICPSLIPSSWATQDWQIQQEMNLKYVAITRAKKALVYVDTATFIDDLESEIILTP